MARAWLRRAAMILLLAAPGRVAGADFADWSDFHRAFTQWPLDSTRVANVASLMLERDAGTIVLEQGRLALAAPFGGRRVAAVFVGRGVLGFAPRTEIERQQLRRFYGVTSLRRTFERLTLVFSDTTLREIEGAVSFHADTLGVLRRAWLGTFPYLTAPHLHFVRPLPMVQMLLDRADDGLFWALASDAKSEAPLFFSLDPDDVERVRLESRPEDDRAGFVRHYNSETVCQFAAAGDPDTLRHDLWPGYEAVHYALDVDLASGLQMSVVADLDVRAHARARTWLGFLLPAELKIDAVSDGGRPQAFFQEPANPVVWVKLERAIAVDSVRTLRFRYHGEAFTREEDWISPRFSTAWYPRPWYAADATWDVTLHYPRDLQVVGAGDRVSYAERGGRADATWRVSRPVPWTSFDAGFLRGIHVAGDSLPYLTVWMHHVDGAGRVDSTTVAALEGANDEDRRTARDVAHGLQFFRSELGAPLTRTINAVETPLRRYEAFPGLVHMMREADRTEPGAEHAPDVVRAHEISHQWFGLGVAPATYHDAWLSEGFANFCSIWYLQAGRHDSRSYLEVLEAWRHELLENRRFPLGEGQQAGPIWLGQRTNSSRTPADYDLVVYAKGAWVLHMLRNVLRTGDDSTETRFRGLLRDFYTRYRGLRATTADFRAAVERAAGEDMGWFFAQWVYGTDVPTYRFTWRAEPAAGGMWRIRGHVEQTNVPPEFRAPVQVRVDFGGGRYSRERVWVSGASCDFTLPLAPLKPEAVVFDDLESVLCEVRK